MCIRDRDKDKARAELEKVLAAKPDNVQARCTKALFLQGEGDLAGARQEAGALKSLTIEDPDDLHRASLTFMELEEYEEAAAFLRKICLLYTSRGNDAGMPGRQLI